MILSLYDCFKHWSKTGSVWLISDTHFGSNVGKYASITSDEQVALINAKVHKNDTLIILGDVGDLSYIPRLKADYKILLKGNHDDKGDSKYKKTIQKRVYDADCLTAKEICKMIATEIPYAKVNLFESYEFHMPFHRWTATIDNNLFDEVYSGPLFISEKLVLSHEPIFGLEQFTVNIHGHCHDMKEQVGCNHLNIASDTIDFEPKNLDTLIKQGLISKVDSLHRVTIDQATELKVKRSNVNVG